MQDTSWMYMLSDKIIESPSYAFLRIEKSAESDLGENLSDGILMVIL